ncbi:PREDICTED: aspartic proteinase-like protein 2 [Tarenaya hassleriana]|uniref:aspartic proteinase-like protein 2 n=1 Tax=Tarenaya hassleriana TaxID=28532 RepID=UPI00053C5203|nr:PREDICTED: aspartic proteinase-like protein 2 [Tarenaya hassleriana]
MDLSRRTRTWPCLAAAVFMAAIQFASANFVFEVQHKFAGREKKLADLKAHDGRRHARILTAFDLPLGGDSRADSAGLYFTKIKLGTPPKEYYVQVDTGSDLLWVNCAPCSKCPLKTDLGIPLSLYDSKASSTSKKVGCEDDFCAFIRQSDSCQSNVACSYHVVYGDGSTSDGDFMRDNLTLDQVTGNLQTTPLANQVVFGCGSNQSGQLGQTDSAVDGIMGFGQSNTSVISQLSSAGVVKRIFSHCLDNVNGGGIFAIGEVESPKLTTTPMVPNQMHYNVNLKGIDVDGSAVDLPSSLSSFGGNGGTIIDSGTTLAYLPQSLFESLMTKILARQPGLKLHIVQETFNCFRFTSNPDEGFPPVNFHFEDSLKLIVYAHDYIFSLREDMYCFGWQSGGMQTQDGSDVILLGDLVLSNKLVTYDLENEVIGWTEYNCSSSIKVKDGSGSHSVGAHDLSPSSSSWTVPKLLTFLSTMLIVMSNFLAL